MLKYQENNMNIMRTNLKKPRAQNCSKLFYLSFSDFTLPVKISQITENTRDNSIIQVNFT